MKQIASLALIVPAVLLAATVMAADPAVQASPAPTAGAASSPMAEGEVKRIDKDTGKLTIKHGPLTNLDMPGMTMVFRVKDRAMLDQVKEGDKIRFVADRVNGAITVVELQLEK